MTAYEVTENAMILLGYSGASGNTEITPRIMSRALMIVNAVYADLHGIDSSCGDEDFNMMLSLSQEINLPKNMQNIMIYGVAAFVAQSEGDSEAQQLWMTVYNRKRAGLSKLYHRKNIFSNITTVEDEQV